MGGKKRFLPRLLGRVLLSALMFAALLGGPIVMLIIISGRMLQ